jgi:hypothetical protein
MGTSVSPCFEAHDADEQHLECDPQAERLSWAVPPAFLIRLREVGRCRLTHC